MKSYTFITNSQYERVWSYLYRIGAEFEYSNSLLWIGTENLTDDEITTIEEIINVH